MRIYIACLASYNAGRLVGQWFDLDDYLGDLDTLYADINNVIRGEEFAIHDYEIDGPLRIGEYDPLDYVLAIAEVVDDCYEPKAMIHWLALDTPNNADEVRERANLFDEAYRGEFNGWKEYAEHYADEHYSDTIDMADGISYLSFDYDALAVDLEQGMQSSQGENWKLYIFDYV